jgi:hypothetical protein
MSGALSLALALLLVSGCDVPPAGAWDGGLAMDGALDCATDNPPGNCTCPIIGNFAISGQLVSAGGTTPMGPCFSDAGSPLPVSSLVFNERGVLQQNPPCDAPKLNGCVESFVCADRQFFSSMTAFSFQRTGSDTFEGTIDDSSTPPGSQSSCYANWSITGQRQ